MRKYNLTINDRSYEVTVKALNDREARVEVNGEEHTVTINDIQRLVLPETVATASPVKSPAHTLKAPSTPSVSVGGVIAPMPGQIKAILVREGDRVSAGQKLLVMEAMKLENKIPSPVDGVVKRILVRDGDIVSQSQELVIIE